MDNGVVSRVQACFKSVVSVEKVVSSLDVFMRIVTIQSYIVTLGAILHVRNNPSLESLTPIAAHTAACALTF